MDVLKLIAKVIGAVSQPHVQAMFTVVVDSLQRSGQLRKPDGKDYSTEELVALFAEARIPFRTLGDEAAASAAAIKADTEIAPIQVP